MITELSTAQFDRDTLDRLCAEVEIAWADRRDDAAVDRLAAQHPEYARSLYDFFALLVTLEIEALPVATNVVSLMEYLTRRTGAKPKAIAEKMKVPYPLLHQVSRYPQQVPTPARREISERAAQAWGLDRAQTLEVLEEPSRVQMAASRDQSYADAPDFREMLKRAKLTKREQEYWLSLGR